MEQMSADGELRFHRLVPPLIGSLAVVRYQVFWYAHAKKDRAADAVLPRLADIRKETYEQWRAGGDRDINPFRDFPHADPQPNQRMQYLYVWWKGMLAHVRVQLHTEYFIVLTSINASRDVEGAIGENEVTRAYVDGFRARRLGVERAFDRLAVRSRRVSEADKQGALNELLGPPDDAGKGPSPNSISTLACGRCAIWSGKS